MVVSHRFAVERASQAAVDGNHMESVCFSLLSLAISDGIRHNPDLMKDEKQMVDRAVAQLSSDFFSNPTDSDVFSQLQSAIEAWKSFNE
jgi:hypothetical protein